MMKWGRYGVERVSRDSSRIISIYTPVKMGRRLRWDYRKCWPIIMLGIAAPALAILFSGRW